MKDDPLHHHLQNTKWENIFLYLVLVELQRYQGELMPMSTEGLKWPNILLRHFMLLFHWFVIHAHVFIQYVHSVCHCRLCTNMWLVWVCAACIHLHAHGHARARVKEVVPSSRFSSSVPADIYTFKSETVYGCMRHADKIFSFKMITYWMSFEHAETQCHPVTQLRCDGLLTSCKSPSPLLKVNISGTKRHRHVFRFTTNF